MAAGTDMKLRIPAVLQVYIERVDAMTLRERVLIFLAIVVVVVGWTVNAVLLPMITERTAKIAHVQAMRDEMRGWDMQIEALARAKASAASNDGEKALESLRQQISELDRQINDRRGQLVPPDRMSTLLGEVLRRNRGLQLASMATLPSEVIGTVPGQTQASMYRHGIELTVSGGYLDIVAYLSSLEQLPVKIFWGGIDLSAAYPVTTIRLSLFTFSPEKTWLAL